MPAGTLSSIKIPAGGADIVIDCVGMDGKMTPMEYLATGLKLQGGALGRAEITLCPHLSAPSMGAI